MENKWPNIHTKIHFVIMGLLAILFFVPAFADTNYDLETIESVSIIGTFEDPHLRLLLQILERLKGPRKFL